MKNIEVLLATSADLDNDNLWFGDLIDNLNEIFRSRQIKLDLVEHIDCSEFEYRQEDFDAKLAGCEMCMVLHSKDINAVRKEEFSKAYNEFMQGRNPRKIYVFFKDIKEEDISESMKDFKRGFVNNFGHFYGVYENVDTLRLQFLLQFELYQNKGFGEKILTVKDEKVQIYEKDVVDLNNVAFARDNEKYKELKAKITELSEKISQKRKEFALDPENDAIFDEISTFLKDKREIEDEYNAHQGFLFDMSLAFTQLATKELNETTKKAMELFEKGFADAADKLLDEEKMDADTENMRKKRANALEVLNESKKEYEAQINAYRVKTKTVMAVSYLSIEVRVKSAYSAYESAIELAEEIDCDKKELARMYFDYAALLHKYARYDRALEYYKKSLKIRQLIYNSETVVRGYDKNMLLIYNSIGLIYTAQCKYDEALEYYERILNIREKRLPWSLSGKKRTTMANGLPWSRPDKDMAGFYTNIGILYTRKGDYGNALTYQTKALTINEEELGKHPDTAGVYNNIGLIYYYKRNYGKALEYYKKALLIYEELFGDKHCSTAITYNNIGVVYTMQGNYEKALESHKKALLVREELLGKNHPDTAGVYNNIGLAYASSGDYKEALKYYKEALLIQEDIFDVKHLSIAMTCDNIARIYVEQSDYEKALEYYKKALRIKEEILPNHRDTAILCYDIKLVYEKQGKYKKALEYYEKAVLIQEEVLGKHPDVANTCNNIAYLYYKEKDYEKALEFYDKNLKIMESLYSATPSNSSYKADVISMYENISSIYYAMGNAEKSEFYKQKAEVLDVD